MAIINSIENIVVKSGKDFKRNEMQDMFTPRARMMDQNLAVMSSLQERAIRNENAYNEMAIKMSEYNAIQGVDEESLAGKIDETQNAIKEKVDEDGGWFFADTAVSDGARRFLTDEGVKTILSNKAQFDALMQANEQSDAPEEYKAANRTMILERFNNAGGSLGGNGKQSITAFGTALGKGHDRSVYQKELLEMMKAWKADKRSVFNAQFINDVTELMNGANTDPKVQAIAQKIIAGRGGNLSGVLTRDTTIESVSEDEIREVFSAVLASKPEFRTAMAKEAEINKWLNNKQGGTNAQLVSDMVKQQIATDPRMQQVILMNSSFANLTSSQKQIAMSDPLVMQRYLEEGTMRSMPELMQKEGETDADYQERMGLAYNNAYTQNSISALLNMAKIGAYTAIESKTDTKWFDNLLLDSLKAKREQLEKIKGQMTEVIGFTRANLPSNAMMSIVDANIKTATDALDNAKATMAKYANATDPTSINLYQQAEKSAIDAENIIKQNNRILNSVFSQYDKDNKVHKDNLDSVKKSITDVFKDYTKEINDPELNKEFENLINSAISPEDLIIKADEFYNNNPDAKFGLFTGWGKLFGGGSDDYGGMYRGKYDRKILEKTLFTTLASVGIEPQTTPITLFTPISNNKAAFSDALDGIGRLLMDNVGIWNFATASLGDDPTKAKFLEKVIGMPLTSSEDFADIFSSRKSGSGSNAAYQISSKNLSIGSDATGRLYLKVTIPAQGENQVQKEAILYTDDDGANMALRDAMRKGAQCSYNQAMTNPYDTYQRQTANEIMAFSGNIEGLSADLAVITDPNARDLNRFNTINNQRVGNISQAIEIIIADKRIHNVGNYYPITSGSFKYNITKTPTGVYKVNVQQYNPSINKYVDVKYNKGNLNFAFENDDALRRNLPSLVYKLNHANELKDNFVPTQYLTPEQKAAYNVNFWSNDVLMLNR